MTSPKPASQVTQTNKTELSPEQKQVFELAFPYVQQYANNPATPYSGTAIAGFNPNELTAQQLALGQAQGPGQATGDAANTASQFLLNPSLLSPDSNPWLAQSGQAITDRMTQNLTEQILPAIRSGSTVAGGMYSGGNTRQGVAEGLAVGRTSQGIGDALSSLYSDAYKTGLGTMGDAVRSSPLAQAAGLFGSQVTSQVGAQERALEQAQLDEMINQYNIQQYLPYATASDLMAMMSGLPGGMGVSTVTGATPRANPVMSGIGGGLSGAMLGSMLFGGPLGLGLGAAGGVLAGML